MRNDALLVTSVVLTGLILVVVIWQAFSVWRATIHGRRESDYRAVAETAAAAARESADHLAEIAETLADLRRRVTAIETAIREVE